MEESKDVEQLGATTPNTSEENPRPNLQKRYVEFDKGDPLNPQEWTLRRRVLIVVVTTFATMVVSFASAIFAAAIPPLVRIHGVDREVVTLGVSLYVLGFAIGPVIWASFSELKGRYLPFVISAFGFTAFSFGTAVSDNLASILICRCFGGFFGAGPLTLAGPLYADIFVGKPFGISMIFFAFTVFMGPIVAQPIGGFIVMNDSLGWRWTEYICGILGAAALLPLIIVLKETYAPVILARKAASLRKSTGDSSIISRHDEVSPTARTIIVDYVALPLKMLMFDPIILLMSLFGSFVYGLLYLFLVGYPVVFQRIRGMSPGVGSLPYLALVVGEVFAVIGILFMQVRAMKKTQDLKGPPPPEFQLPIAVPGALAFSVGLFWYGWSGYKREIHWMVPTSSGLLTGFGLLATFVPSITYLVQARPERPASAIAAHTFLRSLFASVFPLFASYMYNGMGVQWASTLLGCLAALMVPIPIALYIYGPRIRAHSGITYK